MAISGIVFDNQVPTAKAFRGTFKSALSDGIISGCNITASQLTVSIGGGLINVAGGIFQVVGSESIVLTASGAYARIKAVIDLSQEASTTSFNQVHFGVDYASNPTGFASLVQEDINTGAGTTYEAEICVVSIANQAVSGLVRSATAEAKLMYGDTLPDDAPEGTIFLLKI